MSGAGSRLRGPVGWDPRGEKKKAPVRVWGRVRSGRPRATRAGAVAAEAAAAAFVDDAAAARCA